MGNILRQIGSFIVWTLEFLFFWWIAWKVAPELAWAILAFILVYGIIGAIAGVIYEIASTR